MPIILKPAKKKILWTVAGILVLAFVFCLPNPLFDDPMSTVLEDRQGNLMAAKIADDGQWRFPESDSLPLKFTKALTYFEDEFFFQHPGVNPFSLFRALKQNLIAGKTVSGGSTISMQTVRLSRKGKSRNLYQKMIEIILALRMEIKYSKQEILNLYASHAPFGGNVVGLEAASWRYYGRNPYQLSWGELSTLAVLPNAPSLIYPGKNQNILLQKRNRLLDKLYLKGTIDKVSCDLAKEEPLPGNPHSIPSTAPHLLEKLIKDGHKGKRIRSSIHLDLQSDVNRIVDAYFKKYQQNEIYNIAALVLDVDKAQVIAYTGNTNCKTEDCGFDVDIIMAQRSTGSILKPFLYTFMLQEGVILPKTLVADIPTQISGFSPKNFEESYDGMVAADEALARSLNIPAVRMLNEYSLETFYHHLQKLNLSGINKSAGHYGLSLILGGAEASLWDLSNAYLLMAQSLKDSKFNNPASYFSYPVNKTESKPKNVFEAGALWWTFEAMSSVNRPWQENGWQDFQSARKIAWKTGTSYGHRDAWAIGLTPKYIVGIWVGNADGEGRPGLTGLSTAAPIMFDIFKYLPSEEWFEKPEYDMVPALVCKQSGFLASEICTESETILLPKNALETSVCPYHQIIHLSKEGNYRVSSKCYAIADMITETRFVLPPVQEWYYKQKNPFYKALPPYLSDCLPDISSSMAVIYPKQYTRIFIPRELDGSRSRAVFEIAHRNPQSKIYWHLNQDYIGETKNQHRMEIAPIPGIYKMTLVDEQGESIQWTFEVLNR